MNSAADDRPLLDDGEERFVDRLAENFMPAPMSAAERVAFEAALAARVKRPARGLLPVTALAAAAVLIWLAWSQPIGLTLLREREGSGSELTRSWESELFLSSDLSGAEIRDEGETLPEEYVAIASAFLDG